VSPGKRVGLIAAEEDPLHGTIVGIVKSTMRTRMPFVTI